VTGTKGQYQFPVFLPDGRHFLYRVNRVSPDQDGLHLSSLDGKENRRVLTDESSAIFAAGRVLFIRETTLMAVPFDAASGVRGEALPIADAASMAAGFAYALATASETGVLLYQSGVSGGNAQMAWYDRGAKLLATIGAPGPVFFAAISPDEKLIAFTRGSGSRGDLWLRDANRGAELRFTTDVSNNLAPFWSPRGDRIVFSSNRGGVSNLYEKAASGTGHDELLLSNGNSKNPTQWSRDGRFIVYAEQDPKTKWDIWVLPTEGAAAGKPIPFLRSQFNELFGQLSPDSHWMAYTSDESGQREVYVRPFPSGEFQRQISIAGGEQPRWRANGKELFFVAADGKMMAVGVRAMAGTQPSFEPGTPQPLFDAHLNRPGGDIWFEYDVTADGKRFLLDTAGGGSAPVLNVVVNWDAELKK
jgi:hypothetical protein